MIREPQIIVGTKIQDLLSGIRPDLWTLGRDQGAFLLKKPGGLDLI
jgi:hypothetical protein